LFRNNFKVVATQGHIPGYQPMVCGGYHLRVIQVLLSYYPELLNLAINPGFLWWLSSGGYLDLKEKSKVLKCFDLENIG
jgi:hypothetical protein